MYHLLYQSLISVKKYVNNPEIFTLFCSRKEFHLVKGQKKTCSVSLGMPERVIC